MDFEVSGKALLSSSSYGILTTLPWASFVAISQPQMNFLFCRLKRLTVSTFYDDGEDEMTLRTYGADLSPWP